MVNKNSFKYTSPGTVHLFINPTPTTGFTRITNTHTQPQATDEISEYQSERRSFWSKESKSGIHFSKYKDLFHKLIEDKRKYFTEEYGKNQHDYQKYLLNKTDIYDNENYSAFTLEPRFSFRQMVSGKSKFKRLSNYSTKNKSKILKKKMPKGESRLSSCRSGELSKIPTVVPLLKPFQYKLSDPEMLKRGITVDTQITARPIKLFIFKPILTNPLVSGFFPMGSVKKPRKVLYPNNALCAVTYPDGRSILFNKNGARSMAYLPGISGAFFVVYSPKRRYFNQKLEPFPLAMFDLNGNGVVYDEDGKKRLIYDQAQGILFDSPVKIPIKWKWKTYETIIKRRDDMKFVKPDELLDIDHEEKLKQNAKRELSTKVFKKRKAKKTVVHTPSESRAYASKTNTDKSDTRRTRLTETDPKLRVSSRNLVTEMNNAKIDVDFINTLFGRRTFDMGMLKVPVKLKFTKTKCSIEPLLQYCDSVLKIIDSEEDLAMNIGEGSNVAAKKLKSKDIIKRSVTDLLVKCIPHTLTVPTGLSGTITEIKPIVMKITDTVSLTILTQEHIHIDFYSYPIHYEFEIGIIPEDNELKNLYSVKNTQEVMEPIPCFFEVMQDKSVEYKAISLKLKQMRDEASVRAQQSYLNYMKMWGYDVFKNKS